VIEGIFGKSDEAFFSAYENVQNFIRKFYADAGAANPYNISYHSAVIAYVLAKSQADLAHLPNASIFKKSSIFTLNFVLNNPIVTELPAGYYLHEIPHRNCQNALLAFEICRKSLHKAIIDGSDGKTKTLGAKIEPSQHQMGDIIRCLSTVQPAEEAYDTYARMLALIYESLAYEFNDARYKCPANGVIEVKS
jgi:hypothetical protein